MASNSWSGWKSIANASRVVGDHANRGAQAAADGVHRGAHAIQDTTPPAVKERLGQAAGVVNTLPAPVKYGALGVAGAAVLVGPLTAPILGGIYGIGAAGPVAGGAFAGIQAGGAVAAGSSWAVIQSAAMGGALPFIGTVSAGAIGGAVGAASGAITRLARGMV
ncbi:hypothetical protein B0H14DRAFT_2717964 [Mycena olivaceomarginata]|nr:hypothetical protein B0H14DRAFT_2717964 [Mycena olivaceomarginata]